MRPCENPGYPDTRCRAALERRSRVTAGRGRRVWATADAACRQHLDAVFVTPSHHAPTAVTMPPEPQTRNCSRRAAEARDFVIVEDDYEFEMSFLTPPTPALKSLDRSGSGDLPRQFFQSAVPGAPARLSRRARNRLFAETRQLRSLTLRHPPGHLQRTVAYFLALGHYDSLIRDLRKAFAARRKILTETLERAGLEIAGAASFGGSNLWIKGPDGLDSLRFAQALRDDGVLIEPGTPFFEQAPASSRPRASNRPRASSRPRVRSSIFGWPIRRSHRTRSRRG